MIVADKLLMWLPHIKVISAKVTNMVSLLQGNLSDYTKTTAYFLWLDHHLNILCSCVWDPHYDSHSLKKLE